MRRLTRGISTGVGWVREAQHGYEHSTNKDPTTIPNIQHDDDSELPKDLPPSYEEIMLEDANHQWALDDAQIEISGLDEENPETKTPVSGAPEKMSHRVEKIMEGFLERHPVPNEDSWLVTGSLAMPVILPQRRPGSRVRGFVSAYAPMLNDCGIDQTTFLDFLDCFRNSMRSAPWFNVLNLAVAGLHAIPSATVMIASHIAHLTIEAARQARSHYKGNDFLDQMNEVLFKPHGLYCFLVTFDPTSPELSREVNLNDAISTMIDQRDEGHYNKLRSTAQTVEHETQIPESAPLIFPAMDLLDDAERQSVFKKHRALGGDYFDRRARAEYEAKHPESKLTVQTSPQFSSRYSDPNSRANSGALLSLLTGGHVDPVTFRRNRRQWITDKTGYRGIVGTVKHEMEKRKQPRAESDKEKGMISQGISKGVSEGRKLFREVRHHHYIYIY